MGAGDPCVTTLGTFGMLLWPAGSWAVGARWPPQGAPSLGRGLDPSSWMISDVEGTRQPCDSALRGPGANMTVTIGRMLGPCVMVRAYEGHQWGRMRQWVVWSPEVGRKEVVPAHASLPVTDFLFPHLIFLCETLVQGN